MTLSGRRIAIAGLQGGVSQMEGEGDEGVIAKSTEV